MFLRFCTLSVGAGSEVQALYWKVANEEGGSRIRRRKGASGYVSVRLPPRSVLVPAGWDSSLGTVMFEVNLRLGFDCRFDSRLDSRPDWTGRTGLD